MYVLCEEIDSVCLHCRRHSNERLGDCHRFGHSADECVVTYAEKLRRGQRPPDEVLQEHLVDATEALDAAGELATASVVRSSGSPSTSAVNGCSSNAAPDVRAAFGPQVTSEAFISSLEPVPAEPIVRPTPECPSSHEPEESASSTVTEVEVPANGKSPGQTVAPSTSQSSDLCRPSPAPKRPASFSLGHSLDAWELFKQEFRGIAIECGSINAFYMHYQKKSLLKSLYNLHKIESDMPGTYVEAIATAKCQLQEFDAHRYRGARVRCRNNRAMHSESPTRQAILDERHHGVTKLIPDINSNDVLLTVRGDAGQRGPETRPRHSKAEN
ncbi:hypothetical protein HPB48_025473 [Haemaphysalis longicornis]|uniref:Uncharacterized protein n=1 Tax=Haemaphysalis longicornis TaxID=44386 RepID=A0A9J6H7R4_HAELO|nr:hypothetical protein HPB48_025473 [Haemaphysalis longicornis]